MAQSQVVGTFALGFEEEPAARVSDEREHVDIWCATYGWPATWRPGSAPLTRLLASFWLGDTVLPEYLGLSIADYYEFVAHALNGPSVGYAAKARQQLLGGANPGRDKMARERSALRSVLAEQRASEVEDLEQLLLSRGRAGTQLHPLTTMVARILAHGCLGGAHLWKDLGLRDRPQLRALIGEWFPAMLTLNNQDMRWKRFFYRQLCEMGGDYLCRAPSCNQCTSYSECFTSTRDEKLPLNSESSPNVG